MIAPLVLAAALLAAPPAAAPAGPDALSPPSPDRNEILRAPVDIDLEGTSLKGVVEKIAVLLRATPIVAPGVEGKMVDAKFTATPLSKVIEALMAASGTTIRLAGDRLYVYPAGATAPARLSDEELDRRLLANSSLPRRPAGEAVRQPTNVVEFQADEPGAETAIFRLDGRSVLALPGCLHTQTPPSGVEVAFLGGDPFDGALRLAFLESDGPRDPSALPQSIRIVALPLDRAFLQPAVSLPGCRSRFLIREAGSGTAREPMARRHSARQFLATMAILEVGPEGERELSRPRVQTREGVTATIQSGTERRSASGASLDAATRVAFTPLASSGDEVWLAFVASLLRDVEPSPGAAPVTIKVAGVAESLRVRLGETETVVLSSTYGQGRSALILTVKLEEVKRPPAR